MNPESQLYVTPQPLIGWYYHDRDSRYFGRIIERIDDWHYLCSRVFVTSGACFSDLCCVLLSVQSLSELPLYPSAEAARDGFERAYGSYPEYLP